jgi:hypothetical protein
LLRTTPDPLTADEGRPDPFADHPVLGPQFHGAALLRTLHEQLRCGISGGQPRRCCDAAKRRMAPVLHLDPAITPAAAIGARGASRPDLPAPSGRRGGTGPGRSRPVQTARGECRRPGVLLFRVTRRYVGLLDHFVSAKKKGGRNLDA